MSYIIWNDVTGHAPETVDTPTGAQTDILAYVNTALNLGYFGGENSPMTKLARIYLASHFATLLPPLSGIGGAASGPVTSEALGDMSRSYAVSASSVFSASLYGSTIYGRLFAMLLRQSSARVGFVF